MAQFHVHQSLQAAETASFIFSIREGSVVVLGGMDGVALRELIDCADLPEDRRALFVRLQAARSVDAYVEQLVEALAATALRLWPVWFGKVSFAMCHDDTLGRQAAGIISREAAKQVSGVDATWTEEAACLALAGCPPRVAGALLATELLQLSLVVGGPRLILVVDGGAATDAPGAMVHALEWIAQQARAAVVVLVAEQPPPGSPFDRILFGARWVIGDRRQAIGSEREGLESASAATLLTPWRGAPHPLSDIEQRLHTLLANDSELAGLFCFNWSIDTVRGSRPKVDLVWVEGRLVVELDGYADHATRHAFIGDRHRDYELMLSGYTVLRLANDEIIQDFGRAIEKIRDLVRLRRAHMK
jgi:very-short-patch-repair endonuclease